MSITGVNNAINISNTRSLQPPSTLQGSLGLIGQSKNMIGQIDKKINFVENKIAKNKQLSQITKEMLVTNRQLSQIIKEMMTALKEKMVAIDESIRLNKEYIQTVKESKELGEKRISLLQDTNNKLQALLNRNSNKIDVSDVKLLDKQLDTFTKKENVLKAQANVVDTKIEKLASKVDFVEKQITKLEAKSNDIDNSSLQSKPDKNSFAAGYRPTADQIAKLELSKIQLETHDLDSSDTLFQQRVYYSQKNIYESILNSLLLKVFV